MARAQNSAGGRGPWVPRARTREYVSTAEYKEFARKYIEVQKIYRLGSPDSAREIVRLSVEAENEHVRAVCGQMVLERAWGKPREYDPNETGQTKPKFDASLYTLEELQQLYAAMELMMKKQGMLPDG